MNQIDFKISKKSLVDWINSLPVKSCLKINSIKQLYSGEVIIDILEYIFKLLGIKDKNSFSEKIKNEFETNKFQIITKYLKGHINIKDFINFNKENFIIYLLFQIKNLYHQKCENLLLEKPNLKNLIFINNINLKKEIVFENDNMNIFMFLKPTSQIISIEYDFQSISKINQLQNNSLRLIYDEKFIFNQIQNILNWINNLKILKTKFNLNFNDTIKSTLFICNLFSNLKGEDIKFPGISINESFQSKVLKYLDNNEFRPNTIVNNTNEIENQILINNEIKLFLKELRIPFGDKIDFNKIELTEFKDGLLLNQIMSNIDICYKNSVIIDPNPISKSVALMNIKKILNYLRTKKNMPIELLSSEKEIQLGNRIIILTLLLQIKKVFRNFKKNNFKLQNKKNFNFKYNDLKNKEDILYNNNGIFQKRVCDVNGTDHSKFEIYPLNRNQRKKMLMNPKFFFN